MTSTTPSAPSGSITLPSLMLAGAGVAAMPDTLETLQRRFGGNAESQKFYDCANILHPKNPLKRFRNAVFQHREVVNKVSDLVLKWGLISSAFVGALYWVGRGVSYNLSPEAGNDAIRNKLDSDLPLLATAGKWMLGGALGLPLAWTITKVVAGVASPTLMYQQDVDYHSALGRYEMCKTLETELIELQAKQRELQPSWARPENLRTPVAVSDGWHTPQWVAGLGAVLGGIIMFAATRGMPLRAPVTPGFTGGASSSRENFGYSGT